MSESKPHQVWLGLGANLGDRARNLSEALNELGQQVTVERVSPCYETEPWGITDQPRFLNLVCSGWTDLDPRELLAFLKEIERHMGRSTTVRYGPRPIDIDILFYDDLVLAEEGLTIPHPRLHERAFVLAPLADLAPELVHPGRGMTVAAMLAAVGTRGVERLAHRLLGDTPRDVQGEPPAAAIGLQRVGITGLRRAIHLPGRRHPLPFYAELDLFVDLPAQQKGAHMSRFSQAVEEALEEWTHGAVADVETIAERLAQQVVSRLAAARAEVHLRTQFPLLRWAPVTGHPSQEMYTLLGIAAATRERSAQLVGVEAEGITACPCAQEMASYYTRDSLLQAGFSPEEADRVLKVVPPVTHSQRGRGTLLITAHPGVRAEDLVRVVERAMSSETYDLLKRPDELFVILRAHRNPRFVEDVVREMLAGAVALYSDLPDDTFILARQVNFESIHKHNVLAERSATMGDLRRELADGAAARAISLSAWLDGQLSPGR